MERRLELQTKLETLLGSRNVYFQPPETIKMSYPCIVYSRTNGYSQFADNVPYAFKLQYQLIYIDKNPDSIIPIELSKLQSCTFERHYSANNLNHDVFNIYY